MPVITLTTDFGLADHYVGVMKGVVLGLSPTATIVDITHEIASQDLRHGAVVLANAVWFFPPGTVHVAVVDPGVGTARRIIAVAARDQVILAPDNGLVTLVLDAAPRARINAVTDERFFRAKVSRTFHGRDVFAPVAAYLANGLAPDALGPAVSDPVRLPWPTPQVEEGRVTGEVLYADRFGNLVTTIGVREAAALGARSEVHVAGRTCPLVRTYGDASPGTLVALIGSTDRLEVAVVQGSARDLLGLGPGAPVVLWTAGR